MYAMYIGGDYMGYKVKWVEDNLGVTRKALRVFEKAGLMPRNEGNKHREYDEDDIDCIWSIRVLQGIGYTIKEIVNMTKSANEDDFNFEESIVQKILELEEEKKKIELHLGYAKQIKLTGRFPVRPSKIGEVRFDEFQENAIRNWNIMNDPQGAEYARMAEIALEKTPEEWDNSDLGHFLSAMKDMMEIGADVMLVDYVLPKSIVKYKKMGATHPDVQCLIKVIYENYKDVLNKDGKQPELTVNQFSRFYASSYLAGDVAKLKRNSFSQEECEFIAEAVSIFGGYKSYDDLVEDEWKYGR